MEMLDWVRAQRTGFSSADPVEREWGAAPNPPIAVALKIEDNREIAKALMGDAGSKAQIGHGLHAI